MSEHDQQSAVVQWWEAKYPKLSLCLMAYPSGAIIGGRNKWGLISKLKKEGWRKGVPDLFVAVPKNGKYGLWVEMKDEGKDEKDVTTEQAEYLDLMHQMGYEAIWCAGAGVAIAAIEVYMNS